jgi:hypothetical protein
MTSSPSLRPSPRTSLKRPSVLLFVERGKNQKVFVAVKLAKKNG